MFGHYGLGPDAWPSNPPHLHLEGTCDSAILLCNCEPDPSPSLDQVPSGDGTVRVKGPSPMALSPAKPGSARAGTQKVIPGTLAQALSLT